MEAVTKTFRGLLRSGWGSKTVTDSYDVEGHLVTGVEVPSVYNKPIYGWFHGDRDVIALNGLPAIAIDGESVSIDWLGLQTQVKEYNFDILCYVREEDMDTSTSYLNEMVRLVESTVRNLSHWWVFDLCYFDRKYFIDPGYLISNYKSILEPYANKIIADDSAEWTASHGGGEPYTPPREKDLYVSAYLKLFEEDGLTASWATTPFQYKDVWESTSREDQWIDSKYYTTTAAALISKARLKNQVPARFIYDSRIKDISYGFVAKGSNLLRAASIRCYAKEVQNITEFGPL